MKVINPVGRKASTGFEAKYDLRACMCNNEFASARTSNDGCFKCGCDCGSTDFYSANKSVAFSTIRKS